MTGSVAHLSSWHVVLDYSVVTYGGENFRASGLVILIDAISFYSTAWKIREKVPNYIIILGRVQWPCGYSEVETRGNADLSEKYTLI
jgi:hypothetical protein